MSIEYIGARSDYGQTGASRITYRLTTRQRTVDLDLSAEQTEELIADLHRATNRTPPPSPIPRAERPPYNPGRFPAATAFNKWVRALTADIGGLLWSDRLYTKNHVTSVARQGITKQARKDARDAIAKAVDQCINEVARVKGAEIFEAGATHAMAMLVAMIEHASHTEVGIETTGNGTEILVRVYRRGQRDTSDAVIFEASVRPSDWAEQTIAEDRIARWADVKGTWFPGWLPARLRDGDDEG